MVFGITNSLPDLDPRLITFPIPRVYLAIRDSADIIMAGKCHRNTRVALLWKISYVRSMACMSLL